MNVSLKHNVVWLCPEKTGGRILKEIFKNYDFFVCDKMNNFELKPLAEKNTSFGSIIPEKYQNFQIISGVRNPYDRIWSCYLSFYTKKFKPKEFELTKQKFNEWIDKSFKFTLRGVETDPFYDGDDYINKWKFDFFEPQTFIKLETLKNDVLSLDFIKKEPLLFDENIFSSKMFVNDKFLVYNTMYEIKTAKKIYNFYKKHFFKLGYDPFSFTVESLSDEEKINFLHSYD